MPSYTEQLTSALVLLEAIGGTEDNTISITLWGGSADIHLYPGEKWFARITEEAKSRTGVKVDDSTSTSESGAVTVHRKVRIDRVVFTALVSEDFALAHGWVP